MSDHTANASAVTKWKAFAYVLLVLLGVVSALLVIVHVKSTGKGVVTVVYTADDPAAGKFNTGDVIDATDPAADLAPRLGYRYKLFIEDESEDRTSGIAKIGGRVTFVPGARRGQTILADVTRVRERVVDANLIRVLSTTAMPAAPAKPAFAPRPGDPAAHVVAGAEMDVMLAEDSTKPPGREGLARVQGLIVVVDGAAEVGRRLNVRITDRRERIAFAEPTGKPAGTGPLAGSSQPVARGFKPREDDPAAHVIVGAELDVTITEESAQNPGVDGVARVAGLVVFVQGVPNIGEAVNVRVTRRQPRAANAVPTGKPVGSRPAPRPGEIIRRAFDTGGPKSSHAAIVAGMELDLEILERSDKFPDREGIAKVDGLVIFVEGGTNVGQTVRARITSRRETVAFAEVIPNP